MAEGSTHWCALEFKTIEPDCKCIQPLNWQSDSKMPHVARRRWKANKGCLNVVFYFSTVRERMHSKSTSETTVDRARPSSPQFALIRPNPPQLTRFIPVCLVYLHLAPVYLSSPACPACPKSPLFVLDRPSLPWFAVGEMKQAPVGQIWDSVWIRTSPSWRDWHRALSVGRPKSRLRGRSHRFSPSHLKFMAKLSRATLKHPIMCLGNFYNLEKPWATLKRL